MPAKILEMSLINNCSVTLIAFQSMWGKGGDLFGVGFYHKTELPRREVIRFIFLKASFDICTADVVVLVCFAIKSRGWSLWVLGSPSLLLLRIGISRSSGQGWSLCLQCLLLSCLFAFPFLRPTGSELFQVYLFPKPLPSVQEHPVPQLLSGSGCMAEQMCVCCLMVQSLKPTWFPFLACSDTLQSEKDAFFGVIFLIFYLQVCFPCRLHLFSYPDTPYWLLLKLKAWCI